MRPRYLVIPFDAGGYGIWLDHCGESRRMVSYKLTYTEAVRETNRLNGHDGGNDGSPAEPRLPVPERL